MLTFTLSEREWATVLAALNYLRWHSIDVQTEPEFSKEHSPLTPGEIEQLCERLNSEATAPRVIVTIQGGNYQGAAATSEVNLAILDYDNWNDSQCCEDEKAYYAELEEEVARLQETPGACLL